MIAFHFRGPSRVQFRHFVNKSWYLFRLEQAPFVSPARLSAAPKLCRKIAPDRNNDHRSLFLRPSGEFRKEAIIPLRLGSANTRISASCTVARTVSAQFAPRKSPQAGAIANVTGEEGNKGDIRHAADPFISRAFSSASTRARSFARCIFFFAPP